MKFLKYLIIILCLLSCSKNGRNWTCRGKIIEYEIITRAWNTPDGIMFTTETGKSLFQYGLQTVSTGDYLYTSGKYWQIRRAPVLSNSD